MGKHGKKTGEVVTHGLQQEKAMLKDNAVERLESFKKANEELLRQCTLLTASRDSAVVTVEELQRQCSDLHASLDVAMDEYNLAKAKLVQEKLGQESELGYWRKECAKLKEEHAASSDALLTAHQTILNITREKDLAAQTEKSIRELYHETVDRLERFRNTILLWCLVLVAGALGLGMALLKGMIG